MAKFRAVITPSGLLVWSAAAFVILACIARFAQAPSFWLDEAWIAVQLRDPSFESIFARLNRGLYFPRLYLSCIAALREVLGYRIWVLRLIPSLAFIAATVCWARLLAKRSGPLLSAGLLSGALLIGSSFWLDQAIQLKQYSFDVLVALIPFLLNDSFYEDALSRGRNKSKLALLTLPCILSYTYPMALLARVSGWYVQHLRYRGWRVCWRGPSLLIGLAALGLISVYVSDYQFSLKDNASYFSYWEKCILGVPFEQINGPIASRLRSPRRRRVNRGVRLA